MLYELRILIVMYKLKKKKIFIRIIPILLTFVFIFPPELFCVEIDTLRYNNEEVQLDIYNPKKRYCPVAILIHGAAGIEGNRAIRYKRFATDLMEEEIIAINVHYFDSQRKNWIETIIKTIDYAEGIYNAESGKIGLIGYSLGGTIALKVASLDDRVKLLAIIAGYLPSGFTKKDAANLPETYMRAGTADSAINTLYQLQRWFEELDKPFTAKIDKSHGHSVPTAIFWKNWETLVSFVVDKFK